MRQRLFRTTVMIRELLGRNLDATEYLTAEHVHVESLFRNFQKAKLVDQKKEFLDQICTELLTHMQIEEEIFYPACMEFNSMKKEVLEDFEEHHQARFLLKEAAEMPLSDERALAKMDVVFEDILHHVGSEERELFPQARKLFSKSKLRELKEQMVSRKMQILEEGEFIQKRAA